jgi:hypothetical protein
VVVTHPHCADRSELRIAAEDIRPGDYLPPQPALHGSRFRDTGFQVGRSDRDVVRSLPVLSGRLLLYGPDGSLDAVRTDAEVAVRRPR